MDAANLLVFALPLLLVILGWVIGARREKSHYESIHQREALFAAKPCLNTKSIPRAEDITATRLVHGSVVVASDRFKQVLAALRNLFGGEIHSYASLIDRARREALLRMKQEAADADAYVNVKFETATISQDARGQTGAVEVLAYGTALWY